MPEVKLRVWRVEPQAQSHYLLILLDENRQMLPMTIGVCEAVAIQSAMRGKQGFPRDAGTHDLLEQLISQLGGRLAKVVIDDLWNGVYFAKLHIALNGEVVTVDSRPSDAVAIALRAEAPLYAVDSVIAAANEEESEDAAAEEEGGEDEGDEV
jgi:bifunctional DNase/RNase